MRKIKILTGAALLVAGLSVQAHASEPVHHGDEVHVGAFDDGSSTSAYLGGSVKDTSAGVWAHTDRPDASEAQQRAAQGRARAEATAAKTQRRAGSIVTEVSHACRADAWKTGAAAGCRAGWNGPRTDSRLSGIIAPDGSAPRLGLGAPEAGIVVGDAVSTPGSKADDLHRIGLSSNGGFTRIDQGEAGARKPVGSGSRTMTVLALIGTALAAAGTAGARYLRLF